MEKLDKLVTDSLKKDLIAALKGWLGEDSGHNLESLSNEILEVQGMYCKCQSRKCAPHRCWPSIAGWIIVSMLCCVYLWLIGTNFTERGRMWNNWQSHWNQESSKKWAEIEDRLARYETLISNANDYVEFYKIAEGDKYKGLKYRIEYLEKKLK